ncbi:MAG TPA: MBL fold metallo-hydrolase [Candidatus Limnocylindrales bacterium]|nr:MBL fold metallo-hydrolase [Candidatus Limnocylindrales bacterium]
MKLTEHLFGYAWQGRANNCNSYLLKGSRTVLFDPGHIYNELRESCLEMLTRQMTADGIDLAEIDLVLCTHGHPDHFEAAGIIREKSGALFGIHQGDQFILDYMAERQATQTGSKMPSLKPDFYLEEGGLDLNAGSGHNSQDDRIQVLHTPGHSPGCVCFYLPDHQALISGDTIFEGSIGRSDLPGGNMDTLGQSVEKLSQLNGVNYLLPGHMGHVQGATNIKRNFDQIKRYFFS